MAVLKFGHHYPELAAAMLKAFDSDLLPIIEIEETRLVASAVALAEDFMRAKKNEHARVKNEPGNADKMLFSPLMLTARHHCGSLQIVWKETHHIKNKTGDGHWIKHAPVKKGRYGRYPIPRLQKSAGYASDLVEGYEQRAAELREGWKQLMTLKKDIYAAIRRLPMIDADPLQDDIPAGQASIDAASIDTLVPKPVPEPVLSPDKPRNRHLPAPSGPRPRRM